MSGMLAGTIKRKNKMHHDDKEQERMMKEDTRDYIIKARLTESEYQHFLSKVEGSCNPDNMSEYIRNCIFSDELLRSMAVARELKNLNYQIRKIGVLINQIAAGVNAGIVLRGDAELIARKLEEIHKMLEVFHRWFEMEEIEESRV